MKHISEVVLMNPIARALDPGGKQFLRARALPSSMNLGLKMFALLAYGEFSHIKTLPVFQMMYEDYLNGHYQGKSTIVAETSGNTGWAISRLARAFGFENVKIVMSADVPASKRDIFSAMSTVEIITVPKGYSAAARAIEEAQKPGHYNLDQYRHLGNMRAHEMYTGPEIARVLHGDIGLIAIATGSCGTVAGVGRFLKENYPHAIVIGVQPKLGEQVPGARDKQKIAADVTLPWEEVVHGVVEVPRKVAFEATRRLWGAIEPQPGPTSGLAYAGLLQYLSYLESQPMMLELVSGKNVAFLCPDPAPLYSGVIMAELDADQGLD